MTIMPMSGPNPERPWGGNDLATILVNAPLLDVPQQPAQPFVWGQGGQRISPEQLALQRDRAAMMMQSDYSPVGHWAQGLGRVADNWLGALDMRGVERDEQALADQRRADIEGLLGETNADLAPAMASRDPIVSGIAAQLLGARMPQAPEPTQLQRNYDWLVSQGRGEEAENLIGKETNPVRWTPYVDPATGQLNFMPIGLDGPMLSNMEGGGQGISPSPGAVDNTPGDVGYADFNGASRMIESMGPQEFLKWQGQFNTPVQVTSPEQLRALPSGALVIGPTGEVRRKP